MTDNVNTEVLAVPAGGRENMRQSIHFCLRNGQTHEAIQAAREQGVHPGYALKRDYAGMEDALLVCVTEKKTAADIDRLAEVLREIAG